MIVQFFYFYTRTAVFFRMWTQTGWLVNLSVFLSIGTKKSPDAGIMCRQCPEIFLNIRTKSRSFCTNIRVNFLMFTSTFQLFFPSGCLFGSPCPRKAASESWTRFLPAPRRDRPRVLSGSSCAWCSSLWSASGWLRRNLSRTPVRLPWRRWPASWNGSCGRCRNTYACRCPWCAGFPTSIRATGRTVYRWTFLILWVTRLSVAS